MAKIMDILERKGHEVYSIDPEASVFEAITAMADNGVGSLLVARGDDIRGIFTERDYLVKIALQGRSSRETGVHEAMSDKILFVEPDHDVDDAMAIMTDARIRHLPVMQKDRLAGLVSIGDCVREISRERKVQLRYLNEYISDKYPG